MNKVALVIGGSGGIGLETAKALSEDMDVCISYHTNKVDGFNSYKMDLADERSTADAISKILAENKKIDVIVYSVSKKIDNKSVMDLNWNDFQRHIDVQIKGLHTIIRCLRDLIEKGNKIKVIVVLTEYCLGKPPAKISPYITSKYGLMGYVKSMASELGGKNITFNMVSPGMVDTKLLLSLPPKLVELTAHKNPMNRISKPSDVASVIAFLASDKADYLNGVNIPVNGGNIFI